MRRLTKRQQAIARARAYGAARERIAQEIGDFIVQPRDESMFLGDSIEETRRNLEHRGEEAEREWERCLAEYKRKYVRRYVTAWFRSYSFFLALEGAHGDRDEALKLLSSPEIQDEIKSKIEQFSSEGSAV